MKNIILKSGSLLTGVILLTGCSENAWNDKLDGFKEPPVYSKTETVDYTLTAADYKTISSNSTNRSLAAADGEEEALAAIGNNGYFSSADEARKYIPAFISNSSFPYFNMNNGSSVKVGYDLITNQPEEVLAINKEVKTYTVSEENYQEAWGSTEDFIKGFAPITPAAASIPTILLNQYPDAAKGEFAVVAYEEAAVNPVFGGGAVEEPTVYIDQPFKDNMDGFYLENVLLPEGSTYVWSLDSSRGYMKASGYVNKKDCDSEGWLISDEFTLNENANAVLTFDQAFNYFTDAATAAKEATVNIREKGGDWVNLTVPTLPETMGWTFVASGDIDLSAYNGKTVQIRFCYKSTAAKAGTWEVNNVKLADGGATRTGSTRAALAAVPTVGKNAIYTFDGKAWTVPGSMVVLQPADYTAMGQSYGNLSGTLPEQLLPAYLANALPYAAEEAAEIVVYKYYNGSATSYKASQLTKLDGKWVMNNGATVEKFSRMDNVWKFNPSVELVLPYARNTDPTYSYFMAVKDWVFTNVTKKLYPNAEPANGSQPGPPFIDYRNNAEFYSGASAYYGNVDVRASTAKNNAPEGYTGYDGLSDEEISELILKRFTTETFPGALSIVNPDAEPVAGMEVTYTITFTAYTTDGTKEYTVEYVVTGKGQFEFRNLSE
ncbi:MAG: choice-of-anchor J domain-containing protein [Muribaculaceae bacterium]|nr:choice-of-anchor J domain-containing protein [Muribaculaceae bacterium]